MWIDEMRDGMMNQSYYSILMIVVLFVAMYFLMIRPQRKQASTHQKMVDSLKVGDNVVTIGRLHGVISEINKTDKTVVLDVEGIYLTFDLSAIAKVNPAPATTNVEKEAPATVEKVEPTADEATQQSATSKNETSESK